MQKLNWLYPKFLTRIDHYLKINYPHIWRTRVHDFAWFSLIVGNVVAAALGMLIVGRNSVYSEGNLLMIHSSLAVLLGFVGLFWAMRLLRFKIKFSNFKMMLTTWVIYVLCVMSLGLNLVTFTSSVAYQTAYLYSDKTVQADNDYMQLNFSYDNMYSEFSSFTEDDNCYGCLKDEYRTEDLLTLMSRHGYQFDADDEIYTHDIRGLKDRIGVLKEAKVFVWEPILGKDYNNQSQRSFYHEILQINWVMGMLMLFFLPALLFLVSVFGVRNVLISAFCTALIAGVLLVGIETLGGAKYYYDDEQCMLAVYTLVAFVLMSTLFFGRHKLQNWNYIAGVFMLMLGVVFFSSFIVVIDYYNLPKYIIPVVATIMSVSLIVSLMAAWMIAKHNDKPILR